MGTYILGGSNTNDDTGVLNAQGDVNALANLNITDVLTVTGNSNLSTATLSGALILDSTLSVSGTANLSSASLSDTLSVTGVSTLSSANLSGTLTAPNINASTSPLNLQVAGTTEATLDGSGNLTTLGWIWQKGRNVIVGINPNFVTTTSTTPVAEWDHIYTPSSSGNVFIVFIGYAYNDTLSDGVTVGLYTSLTARGDLTTLHFSNTFTQEGAVSNPHLQIVTAYLGAQTIGTPIYISIGLNAVSGGTASLNQVLTYVCEL